MPAWPSTVPTFVLEEGYSEAPRSQALRTAMDTGPKKVRRRFTKFERGIDCTIACTPAQVTAFEAFWLNDCEAGTIPFDWLHPRTRAAMTWRFGEKAPSYRVVSGSAGEQVRISFQIETP